MSGKVQPVFSMNDMMDGKIETVPADEEFQFSEYQTDLLRGSTSENIWNSCFKAEENLDAEGSESPIYAASLLDPSFMMEKERTLNGVKVEEDSSIYHGLSFPEERGGIFNSNEQTSACENTRGGYPHPPCVLPNPIFAPHSIWYCFF